DARILVAGHVERLPELVTGTHLADQPGGVVVDEAPAHARGHQALVVEAAEAVFLVARAAVPEGSGQEVEARLAAGLPAPGRGAALGAHVQSRKPDAVFPGVQLACRGDAGV